MQPEAQGRQLRVPTGLVFLTTSVHHYCVLNHSCHEIKRTGYSLSSVIVKCFPWIQYCDSMFRPLQAMKPGSLFLDRQPSLLKHKAYYISFVSLLTPLFIQHAGLLSLPCFLFSYSLSLNCKIWDAETTSIFLFSSRHLKHYKQ